MEEIRKSGRTTRIADKAIQELFKKGKVIIEDHSPEKVANRFLFKIILTRLENEHGGINRYLIDRDKRTIEIRPSTRSIQHK